MPYDTERKSVEARAKCRATGGGGGGGGGGGLGWPRFHNFENIKSGRPVARPSRRRTNDAMARSTVVDIGLDT